MIDFSAYAFLKYVFYVVFGVIGLCCIAGLVYGVREKRFTDKLVAVNLVTTLSLNAIMMLAVLFGEDYVLDIALIYALLGFAAVAVLAKLLGEKNREEKK